VPSEVWRTLVRKYIVYDVPDEMAACIDCRVVRCSNDNYETCANRLAHAAALRAARTAESVVRAPFDSDLPKSFSQSLSASRDGRGER
jgi:hypothetical protein